MSFRLQRNRIPARLALRLRAGLLALTAASGLLLSLAPLPVSPAYSQPDAPAADTPKEPDVRGGAYENPITRDYYDRAVRAFDEAEQAEQRVQSDDRLTAVERERLEQTRREKLLEAARLVQQILGERELREGVLYRRELNRYVGASRTVRDLLVEKGPLALTVYREHVDSRAEHTVRRALASGDTERLAEVAVTYPFATAALPAGIQAARVFWEAGNMERAAALCRRLLERGDLTDEQGGLLVTLAAHAYGLNGQVYEARELVAMARRRFPAARVAVGRTTRPLMEVVIEQVQRAEEQASGSTQALGWHMQAGDPTGSNRGLGSVEPREVKWHDRYPNPVRDGRVDSYYMGYPSFGLPRRFPVADESILVVPNRTGVQVYSLFEPRRLWAFQVPMETQVDRFGRREGTQFWLDEQTNRDPASIDTATIADNEVYVPLEQPMQYELHDPAGVGANRGRNQVWGRQSASIITFAPRRKLYSFDARTGDVRWSVGGEWQDRELPIPRTLSYTTAPLVLGDRVYAVGAKVLDQNAHVFVAAFERKPRYEGDQPTQEAEVAWLTKAGSGLQETNLFGRPTREPVPSGLAYQAHRLFLSTNIGTIVALDALTGEQVWSFPYQRIPFVPPLDVRNFFRELTWFNQPPLVHDGRVIVAPMDSRMLYCLDAATGQKLWELPWRNPARGIERPRYVLGVHDGYVYWCSARFVFRAHLDDPRRQGFVDMTQSPRTSITGRPIIVDGMLYAATSMNEIRVVDLSRMRFVRSILGGLGRIGGNLALSNGVLIAASEHAFGVAYDWESLIADLQQREQQHPTDPRIKLRIADISRQRGAAGREMAFRYYARVLELTDGSVSLDAIAANREANRGLLSLWMEAYEQARERQDVAGQRDALEAARRHVRTPPDGIALLLLRLRHARRHAGDETLDVLEELREAYGAFEHTFPGYGTVPVAQFALIEGAQAASSMGRHAQAMQMWQAALERYPRATINGRTVAEVARERIAELLQIAGRGPYREIEQRARQAYTDALARRNVQALLDVAARYPNSFAAAEALLTCGRWGLEQHEASPDGQPPDAELLGNVVEVLRRVRDEYPDSPHRAEAMLRLAEAYTHREMYYAARAAYRHLQREYGGQRIEMNGELVDVSARVQHALQQPAFVRLLGETPLPGFAQVPLRLVHDQALGSNQRPRLLTPAGDPGGFADQVYLIVNRRLMARHAVSGEFLWENTDIISEYGTAYVANRLAVIGPNGLHLLDPETGAVVQHLNLGYAVNNAAIRDGLAAIVSYEHTNDGYIYRVGVVNLETGELVGPLLQPFDRVFSVTPLFVGDRLLLHAHGSSPQPQAGIASYVAGYRLTDLSAPLFVLDRFPAQPRGYVIVLDDEHFGLMLSNGTLQIRSTHTGGVLGTYRSESATGHNRLWALPELVVFADLRGRIVALAVEPGAEEAVQATERWTHDFARNDRVSNTSLLTPNAFYCVRNVEASKDIRISAHNLKNGERLWETPVIHGESDSYHVRGVYLTREHLVMLVRQVNQPTQRTMQHVLILDRNGGTVQQRIEFSAVGHSIASVLIQDDRLHLAFEEHLRIYAVPGD